MLNIHVITLKYKLHFYTIPAELNGMQRGMVCVHSLVCLSPMKCRQEQTTEPRCANFGKHSKFLSIVIQIINIRELPNCQRSCPSFSRSKICIEKFTCDYFANDD